MKFVKYLFFLAVFCILLGAGSIYGLYKFIEPQLPDVATLKDVRLQIPMQIYSADGELIAQYGEKRRIPLTLNQIPPEMVKAFIATEDSRFYDHHGVDPIGIFRAASVALFSGHASQGASTITQQLARNFFLSPERTLMRKIKEAFLAVRIEQLLTKDEILELYLNKIYLGYRAYGVGAAAQVYFGKTVDQLSLSEIAVIAGLPKAPSTFNPLYSLERATARRNVVLSRMLSEGYISQSQYDEARSETINANYHAPEIAFSAPYLTEMVRQEMISRYGENAYEDGYKVYTTITRRIQQAAQKAVRDNVMDYDMRHGYRGPSNVLWRVGEMAWDSKKITDSLKNLPTYGPLLPAVVTSANPDEATALLADNSSVSLKMDGVRWAPLTAPIPHKARRRAASPTCCRQASRFGCVRSMTAGGSRRCRTSTRRWFPSTRKMVRYWRWWAALISTRASSTVRPRRCARSARTLSRSCIRRRWTRA